MNKLSAYCQSLRTQDAFFNISYVLMMLLMAFLPFTTYHLWPIGIGLFVLWVSQWNWREKWENFKANDGIPYGIFLLCIFLIPILGFINSTNKTMAWHAFDCYLWFFFSPLIFLTISPKLWSRKHTAILLALFSVGEISLLLFFFIRGIYKTATTGDSSFLYNTYYCYDYHHAYIALYATLVYALIFYYLTENSHRISIRRKILLYGVALFLSINIFCVYSRAGILTFLFIHIVLSIYAIYRKPSRWKFIVGIIFLVFALFAILIATSPRNRFTESYLSFHHEHNDKKDTDARLIIWQAAWDSALENLPWGVGIGDGNDAIVEKYHENGFWLKSDHSYNAHNQFLFALLTNGIPGLIIILLFFYAPLGLAIKHRDILMFSLFLLMTLNCLVECMFDRRAGVDFFAVMIPIMLLRNNTCSME